MIFRRITLLTWRSIICAILSFVAGCTEDVPIGMFPDHLNYIEYSEGRPSTTRVVRKGDALYEVAFRLLRENPHSWERDVISYAPIHYFRAGEFNINFTHDVIVVNYKAASGSWVQLSKRVAGSENEIIRARRD